MKRDDIYYQALLTRDSRFDGKFFVGVKTTGIYCRPICPAKPKRKNVEFFSNYLAAEKAGYRPCLRCRPESAPMSPTWIGKSAVVRRAIKVLNTQETLILDENQFAAKFGVTARHLRRLFIKEIGKTPKQLSFENRLNLARKLLVESTLPISEVAFASGFRSLRRFNDAFKERFKRAPLGIRRLRVLPDTGLRLSLSYRPPFDFEGLLRSYESHRVGDLEWFTPGKMHRVIEMNGKAGQITLSNDAFHSKLIVEIDFPDTSMTHAIVSRVRAMFDLDSDPAIIANSLETDADTKNILKKHPGVRMASGWDPFEIAIGTILGQFVSLEVGRFLVMQLTTLLGRDSGIRREDCTIRLFPTPAEIAHSDLKKLKTTKSRKRTLVEFSRAVSEGRLSLEPTQDVDEFMKRALQIHGIGPWTASYLALKVLRHTDAFPETDLILARVLELHPKHAIDRMSPWRGYAASLYWREYAQKLKKKGNKNESKTKI